MVCVRVHLSSLIGNMAEQECFFTFNHEERAHNLFKELSEMCHRGCDLRKGITARVHR